MINQLIQNGANIPNPESIEIGSEVNLDQINPEGLTIHSGCKIFGKLTHIMQDVTLGYEGPATINSCYIGPQVSLNGGFFKESVFLKKSSMGSGSHVRQGTILEEEASGAHTVGLKQTILFPFVTLGSLINFCDCLMAGGTNRRNHSEVGSSYIHFNYTPNQDKATPSIMGDVPKGVMLNQNPIFLGGQGGIVGPCRFAYGTVIAAGSIYRKDEFDENKLLVDSGGQRGRLPFDPIVYQALKRIIVNNTFYISNLIALLYWYKYVRSLFISIDYSKQLHEGLCQTLINSIHERIKRLKDIKDKMPNAIAHYQKKFSVSDSDKLFIQKNEFYNNWHQFEDTLNNAMTAFDNCQMQYSFLNLLSPNTHLPYIDAITHLPIDNKQIGTKWLQSIVDQITHQVFSVLPSFVST